MIRAITGTALFLALIFVSTTIRAQSKTEKEIIALSQKRVKWLLEGKVDSLATIYDENGITVHTNGMIKTSVEHLDDVKNGRPTYKSIEIKSNAVKDFGNTAILVGTGVFKIVLNGTEMNYNMVYTEVYLKKKNKWTLISRHANSVN